MTSYSSPISVSEKKGFFDTLSSGAQSFNTKISPILQAGSNIIQTGKLAFGLTGLGLESVNSMLEYGRSLSAGKSDSILQSYYNDVLNNPQLLTPELISKVEPHLNNVGRFIDMYQNNRSITSDSAIANLNDRYNAFSELYNRENIEDNVSAIVQRNRENEYIATQKQLEMMSNLDQDGIINAIDKAFAIAKEPSFIEDVMQIINRNTNFPIRNKMENLLNTYTSNIDKNTSESTREAIKAVKDLADLVKTTGDADGMRALSRLKYDLAVRLKRWER